MSLFRIWMTAAPDRDLRPSVAPPRHQYSKPCAVDNSVPKSPTARSQHYTWPDGELQRCATPTSGVWMQDEMIRTLAAAPSLSADSLQKPSGCFSVELLFVHSTDWAAARCSATAVRSECRRIGSASLHTRASPAPLSLLHQSLQKQWSSTHDLFSRQVPTQ